MTFSVFLVKNPFQELQQYIEKPTIDADLVRLFKPTTLEFIRKNVIENPFPMCYIIHLLPSSIASQIFYEALQHFADLPTEDITAVKRQLYSLLVNANIVGKWLDKCETHLFDTLFHQIDIGQCKELPLVLVASKWLPLTKAYASFVERQSAIHPYRKESIYFLAKQRQTHFLESIASDNEDICVPEALVNVVQLIKIGLMIDNAHTKVTNFNRYDEICKRFDRIDASQLLPNQFALYTEFNRILSLYKFVRHNRQYEYQCDTIAVRSFAATYNVIDFLYSFNNGSILTTTSDYSSVRRMLVANEQFNRIVSPAAAAARTDKISEIHLYDQFYAVDLLYELLFVRPYARDYERIVAGKCDEISRVLVGIDDSRAFVGAVEVLFAVLFVRWEHVNDDAINRSDTFSSVTTIDDSDTVSNEAAELKRTPPRGPVSKTGFVCTFTVLQTALDMLQASMVNHQLTTDIEEIRTKFKVMKDEVDTAKWRLRLVDSYYAAKSNVPLEKSLKAILTPCYPLTDSLIVDSSDDDEAGTSQATTRATPVLRRKLRRRKPAPSNEAKPDESLTQSSEFEYGGYRNRRGFINQMLGTFTDMATICFCTGDYAEARRIIEVGCRWMRCGLTM